MLYVTIPFSFLSWHANNETGQLLPVKEIGNLLLTTRLPFHWMPFRLQGNFLFTLEELGADFVSISAHKFHGPKGVGMLYHNDLHFGNLLHGGEQEEKRRASTENLVGIAGMTAAYKHASEKLPSHYQHVETIRQTFLDALPFLTRLIASPSLPHVINISFPGKENGPSLNSVRFGWFRCLNRLPCTAGTVDPSHVIQSLYGKDSDKLKQPFALVYQRRIPLKNPRP